MLFRSAGGLVAVHDRFRVAGRRDRFSDEGMEAARSTACAQAVATTVLRAACVQAVMIPADMAEDGYLALSSLPVTWLACE